MFTYASIARLLVVSLCFSVLMSSFSREAELVFVAEHAGLSIDRASHMHERESHQHDTRHSDATHDSKMHCFFHCNTMIPLGAVSKVSTFNPDFNLFVDLFSKLLVRPILPGHVDIFRPPRHAIV